MDGMNAADYLLKLERDMTGGFLHLLVLEYVQRLEPIHGYGLIRGMEEAQAPGQWKEGTVYPLLAALEKEGLVKSRWGRPGRGARRKYYETTPAGREIRDLAILKWQRLRARLDTILEDPE